MKVIVVSTHVTWPPHFETDLELIKLHLEAGDEVIHLVCNTELHTCDIIVDQSTFVSGIPQVQWKESCNSCITKRKSGVSLLKRNTAGKIKELPLITTKVKSALPEIAYTKTELRKIAEDNYEVGESILSSLISHIRNPNPDLLKCKAIVDAYYLSGLNVYYSMLDYIKQQQPDCVYVFNGRFVHARAVLRACQKAGIDCYIHERGHNLKYYALYKNVTPHNLDYVATQIQNAWIENEGDAERNQVGEQFFLDRRKGKVQSWYSFTDKQVKNQLPESWDQSKTNIVIFNSSEDEFEAIGPEWKNPVYESQLQAIEKIMLDARITQRQDLHFYLRIHPNLKNVNNDYNNKLVSYAAPNLTTIDATSEIDSYALLDAADMVITFGSTMGIEAVYWGKPSILAGVSFYKFLNGTYNAVSHEDMVKFITTKLEPRNKQLALIYGYYMNSYGVPFKFYKPSGVAEGEFLGVNLETATESSLAKKSEGFLTRFMKIFR